MTLARITLRASDFSDPETSSRRLTQVLNTMQSQLGAATKRLLVDVPFITDNAGNVPPIALQPPSWPVKAVVPVYAWDVTSNVGAFLRVAWRYDGGQLTAVINSSDVAPSSSYALRLELSGG